MLRFSALFLTGIFLTKSDLALHDIGMYESLLFVSGAFSFFWVNGILNGLLSAYKSEVEEKNSFFFNTALLLVFLNTLLVALLFLFRELIIQYLPEGSNAIYSLVLAFLFLNNTTFLIEHILLLKEKAEELIIWGIVQFLGVLSAVVIPVYLGWGIEAGFYGLICWAVLKNGILFTLLIRESTFKLEGAKIKTLVALSVPLILSFLLAGSAEYIDGFLVSSNYGSAEFAIFRYGARELPLAVLLASALSSSFVSKLSSTNKEEALSNLKKESLKLMHLLFPITILLLLLSTWLYPIVFRPEFIQSAPVFNTFLLLLCSRVLFPQTLVLAARKTKVILKLAMIELIINFSCSYFLMLQIGLIGIAAGTVIAFYLEKFILVWYVHKKLNIQLSQYTHIKIWMAYSFLLFLVYFLTFKHL